MAEYVLRKREAGLARMTLSTKRAEIARLEKEAADAERRIAQREETFRDAAARFDEYVRDNDMRAIEAVRKAEAAAKGKVECSSERKRLQAAAAAAAEDVQRQEEALRAAVRLRAFLDRLTPIAWVRDALASHIAASRPSPPADALPTSPPAAAASAAAAAAAATPEPPTPLADGGEAQRAAEAEVAAMGDEAVLEAFAAVPPDEVPKYWVEPERLVKRFVELEEANLFLIEHCREAEEALDDLHVRFRAAKDKMGAELATLRSQIAAARAEAAEAAAKRAALATRAAAAREARTQVDVQVQLLAAIAAVHVATGLGEPDPHVTATALLTAVEARVGHLRAQLASLPPAFAAAAVKQREKERRRGARAALLEAQRAKREMRSALALARAQAPARRRVGKPAMGRSQPVHAPKAAAEAEATADDGDEFDQLGP